MTRKLSLLVLFFIGFLTYLPSFGNQFLWDDEQFIYQNVYVQEFNLKGILTENTIAGAGQSSDYYRPLTTLSFAIDHAIWGLKPFGFHITNTLLHVGVGLLLFLILGKIKLGKAAFWISLFFLVHPLQTEAVTYINSRGDSLYTLITFSSLWFWIKALYQEQYELKLSDRTLVFSSPTWLVLSLLLLVSSFFAKEIAVASVGLHGLVGLHFLMTKNISLKHLWSSYKMHLLFFALFIASVVGYFSLRATVFNFENSFNLYGEENPYTSNLAIRVFTFCKIIFIYLKLIILPFPLHMERDTSLVTSWLTPWPWLVLILVTTLISLSWWEWKKKSTLWISLGALWFFGMLVPVSGIVPINGLLYEHWLYVPLIGFFICLFGCTKLMPMKIQFLWPAVLLSVFFICLTLYQNYLWRSPIPFYEYTLKHANSARLHNNLAMAYDEAGRHQEAISEYQRALTISNSYPQIYYNLGRTYAQIGDLDNAEKSFKKALQIAPNFDVTYGQLIQMYVHQKRFSEALELLGIMSAKYPQDQRLIMTIRFVQSQATASAKPN